MGLTAEEQKKLYAEYRDKVFGYIRARVNSHEDAEDLCATVFEHVIRAADGYDPAKASPGTWIYAITRNIVNDYFRRWHPTVELPEELSNDSLPEEGLLQEELLDALAAALEDLDPELTDVIVLRYYDGLPLTEIAQMLGMSYGAIKIRHQKALTSLKAALKDF